MLSGALSVVGVVSDFLDPQRVQYSLLPQGETIAVTIWAHCQRQVAFFKTPRGDFHIIVPRLNEVEKGGHCIALRLFVRLKPHTKPSLRQGLPRATHVPPLETSTPML